MFDVHPGCQQRIINVAQLYAAPLGFDDVVYTRARIFQRNELADAEFTNTSTPALHIFATASFFP